MGFLFAPSPKLVDVNSALPGRPEPVLANPREHAVLGAEQGLPPIDSFEIALLHRATADPLVKALAMRLGELLNHERASKTATPG